MSRCFDGVAVSYRLDYWNSLSAGTRLYLMRQSLSMTSEWNLAVHQRASGDQRQIVGLVYGGPRSIAITVKITFTLKLQV